MDITQKNVDLIKNITNIINSKGHILTTMKENLLTFNLTNKRIIKF